MDGRLSSHKAAGTQTVSLISVTVTLRSPMTALVDARHHPTATVTDPDPTARPHTHLASDTTQQSRQEGSGVHTSL